MYDKNPDVVEYGFYIHTGLWDEILIGGFMYADHPDGPSDADIMAKARTMVPPNYTGAIELQRRQLYTCVVCSPDDTYNYSVTMYVRENKRSKR